MRRQNDLSAVVPTGGSENSGTDFSFRLRVNPLRFRSGLNHPVLGLRVESDLYTAESEVEKSHRVKQAWEPGNLDAWRNATACSFVVKPLRELKGLLATPSVQGE